MLNDILCEKIWCSTHGETTCCLQSPDIIQLWELCFKIYFKRPQIIGNTNRKSRQYREISVLGILCVYLRDGPKAIGLKHDLTVNFLMG